MRKVALISRANETELVTVVMTVTLSCTTHAVTQDLFSSREHEVLLFLSSTLFPRENVSEREAKRFRKRSCLVRSSSFLTVLATTLVTHRVTPVVYKHLLILLQWKREEKVS